MILEQDFVFMPRLANRQALFVLSFGVMLLLNTLTLQKLHEHRLSRRVWRFDYFHTTLKLIIHIATCASPQCFFFIILLQKYRLRSSEG